MGLAVSGGTDSLALAVLMHEVAPRNFQVATVDHGLRPESAAEAAMVARHCADRAIPHRTLRLSLDAGSAVQERARIARYAALAQWARDEGLVAVVTAHHADDQAETMVMRLNRGAGLRGLAGMRPLAVVPGSPDLPLLRPLLGWRRPELAGVVQGAGLVPADDPSNRDIRYERVRVRNALTSCDGFDANGFAASAGHLAEADAAVEWMVDRLWADVADEGGNLSWSRPPELPKVLSLRMLERMLAALGAGAPRGGDLARWLAALDAGRAATLGGVKGDARRVPWRFTRAPERKA